MWKWLSHPTKKGCIVGGSNPPPISSGCLNLELGQQQSSDESKRRGWW